jgi:hypothetical protein
MRVMRKFYVGTSGAAVLSLALVAMTTPAPASASIGPNPKLVGTYNVKVKLNPAFGGTKLSGQIKLTGDGTWTGNVLNSLGCIDRGTWLTTGTVLALSDADPGPNCDPNKTGLTWMIAVGANQTFGSAASPGYPHAPPAPHTTSTIGPSSKLVGSYNASVTTTLLGPPTGTITLKSDGTWATSSGLGCSSQGSWLSSGKTVSLSDAGITCVSRNGYGGSWMAAVKSGSSLGTAAKPGYINWPYIANGTWYATHS